MIVGELAADQWGLLTTRQAARRQVTRLHLSRLAERGHLERVSYGVYAQPVALADPQVELKAAWLALDPTRTAAERLTNPAAAGVVSHTSAASLHGIGTMLDDEHHYTLPQRHRSRRDDVRTHRADLTPDDVTLVDGLPTTTPARTILDLVADHHDLDHVGQALRDAVTTGKVTVRQVRSAAERVLGAASSGNALAELLEAARLDPTHLAAEVMRNPIVHGLAAQMVATTAAEWLVSMFKDENLPAWTAASLIASSQPPWSQLGSSAFGADLVRSWGEHHWSHLANVSDTWFKDVQGLTSTITGLDQLNAVMPTHDWLRTLTAAASTPAWEALVAAATEANATAEAESAEETAE